MVQDLLLHGSPDYYMLCHTENEWIYEDKEEDADHQEDRGRIPKNLNYKSWEGNSKEQN